VGELETLTGPAGPDGEDVSRGDCLQLLGGPEGNTRGELLEMKERGPRVATGEVQPRVGLILKKEELIMGGN